jgi:hypothetical protein
MQAPAAVARPGRDGGAWRLAVATLQGLAVAALLTWALSAWLAPAGLAVAAWAWRRTPAAAPRIAWDGSAWHLDGVQAEVRIVFDLGGWMLLRVEAAAGTRWLPLSPAADPAGWPAMRAALYSSVSSAAESPARVPGRGL